MEFPAIKQDIIKISTDNALNSKGILFESYYNNALTINIIFRIMKKDTIYYP